MVLSNSTFDLNTSHSIFDFNENYIDNDNIFSIKFFNTFFEEFSISVPIKLVIE
jgi:hypothetical protein